ncbi:DM DNA binding domain protein [Cooperia oncophora]
MTHKIRHKKLVTFADVKRHCGMCRQHGVVVETRGHICQFKNCECDKCKLVRKRRSIMSTQIRLRREQDKRFQRTTIASEADVVPSNGVFEPEKRHDISLCYFCQKCKNHGVLMWKKSGALDLSSSRVCQQSNISRNRKWILQGNFRITNGSCEYANCRCEQCDLIDTRRALDRHIKNSKEAKSTNSSDYGSSSSSEEYSSGSDSNTGSLPFVTMPVSLACSTKTIPLLPTSDIPLLKPAINTNGSLLLPGIPSAFLPPSPLNPSLLPLSSLLCGGLIPNTSSDFLVSNFLSALSPFEIQLLLTSFRSSSGTGACLNFDIEALLR